VAHGVRDERDRRQPHLSRGTSTLARERRTRRVPVVVVSRAYAASKAALEESIRGWRAENPDMSFSCIVVGPTAGTEFGTTWDPERTMEMLTFWDEHGYPATDSFMSLDDMASAVVQVLASPICVQHVVAFADRSTTAG